MSLDKGRASTHPHTRTHPHHLIPPATILIVVHGFIQSPVSTTRII
jgi:hypothetical protein